MAERKPIPTADISFEDEVQVGGIDFDDSATTQPETDGIAIDDSDGGGIDTALHVSFWYIGQDQPQFWIRL